MAGIFSIPLEVLFLITGYLDADDIKSLRLTCQDLNAKAEPAHLDELFGRRTYFATVADLRQLLKFTQHESKVNLKLKHLRLDVASPYIFIQPTKLMGALKDEAESNFRSKFDRACFANDCYNFEATEEKEDQALLASAIQSLPNLEVIEFIVRAETPSINSLKIHYPDLIQPELEEDFLAFYKEHLSRQRTQRLHNLFLYVMVALKHSQCRMKEILMDSTTDEYMFVGQDWFGLHRRHAHDKGLSVALCNLKVLEMNFSQSADADDDWGFDGNYEDQKDQLECIPKFLSEVVPNVESLKLRWDHIEDVWMTEVWAKEYKRHEPNLLLRNVKLRLPRLKRLELHSIPFVEEELVEELLRPHRATLRHLVFDDCCMQDKEHWSAVFALNGSVLDLDYFSYRTKVVFEYRYLGRRPIIFKVQGNISSTRCVCDVQLTGLEDGPTKTDFESAVTLVREFEEKILGAKKPKRVPRLFGNLFDDNDAITISSDSEESDDFDIWGGFEENDDDDDDDDDEEDDDDFANYNDGPALLPPVLHYPPNSYVPPIPLTTSSFLASLTQTSGPQTYRSGAHLFSQFPSFDPTGNLVHNAASYSTLPPGSIMVPTFAIPSQFLNSTALEGQPLTVQNILSNLAPNALGVGVNVPADTPLFGLPIVPGGSSHNASSSSTEETVRGPSEASKDVDESTKKT